MAALIAWMLVVRVGNLVKDGAISAVTRVFDALWRRRLRRSSILDKIANTNRVPSKRSRPLSGPS
jgi:FtsZ-interacting cell division protein ZipA